MIRVSGTFELRGSYTVELDMTEEEFDKLPFMKQTELLDSSIDWAEECRQAEVEEIEVDEIEEVDEEESA